MLVVNEEGYSKNLNKPVKNAFLYSFLLLNDYVDPK